MEELRRCSHEYSEYLWTPCCHIRPESYHRTIRGVEHILDKAFLSAIEFGAGLDESLVDVAITGTDQDLSR